MPWLLLIVLYSAIWVSGFGMSVGLGADFWICLFWVDVLFLGFCFLSGFFQHAMVLCCLFFWPVQLACSWGMHADVGGWDTGMSWGKEG